MLQRGQQIPHFTVHGVDGREVAYASIWQHRHLLLVSIGNDVSERAAVEEALSRRQDFDAHDTAIVITADDIPGVPRPGTVVVDRWGEVAFVAAGPIGSGQRTVDELLGWVRHVQQRCPECEGESR